jgi:hypothetical protein
MRVRALTQVPPPPKKAKREYPVFNDCSARAVLTLLLQQITAGDLSPCQDVDQLWHRVLLETQLRQQVDKLVGGEVPHDVKRERVPDEVKAARRLNTMNALVRSGARPCLVLWKEAGTLMQHVREVEGLPEGSDPLYVLDSLPDAAARAEYELHLRQLFDIKVVVEDGRVLVLSASAQQMIQVFIKGLDGVTSTLNVSTHTLVGRVKHMIFAKMGIPPEQQRLIFAGGQLEDDRALFEYGIGRESTMQLVLRLSGC